MNHLQNKIHAIDIRLFTLNFMSNSEVYKKIERNMKQKKQILIHAKSPEKLSALLL